MFCGGIFAYKNISDDLFICSDGVEMTQKELLNIVRAIASRIQQDPLPINSRRVLFVGATSTYLRWHRGYIFGVSTYHNFSIPLLSSTMERVTNCINAIHSGSGDIDLRDYSNRSVLYHAIRSLLTQTPGGIIPQQVTKSLNNIIDVSINPAISFKMEPKLSGDFTNNQTEPKYDSSTNETSVTDSLASNEVVASISDSFPVEDSKGFISAKLLQEAQFNFVNNTIQLIECNNSLEIKASGGAESGPLCFAMVPGTLIEDEKYNQQILNFTPEGIYKCEKPLELLQKETKVLVFQSKVHNDEALPFQVASTFERENGKGKIQIKIRSKVALSDIIIGVDSEGFGNPEGENCEVSLAGSRILLKINDIKPDNGETVTVIWGGVDDSFQPPKTTNLRCLAKECTLGNIVIKTDPNGNFSVKSFQKELFISRSDWEFKDY
ncbi:hypothetical protein GPJ56_000626 [Histomonas meleagridis]|uniref:uncharacterized protein n=1 Tax=Histomonas meleagridis TaxID=135588 RepID=UPI00355A93F5|nr:hypothetical protein GPJ56_000626 [Histomonas meleagridis]KAH0804753.1 hypothetical protein GO595_002447 [Histomonas meleagridis]